MQSLGKVVATSRRMPSPASLPSLRSENAGNDPTIALVPSGGGGWKSKKGGKENQKEGEAPPSSSPPPPPPSHGQQQQQQQQQPKDPSPEEEIKGGPRNRGPYVPPLHSRPPLHSPGKQFKSDFPTLEKQEMLSKKEFEEVQRRQRAEEGSPEPSGGKWRGGETTLY